MRMCGRAGKREGSGGGSGVTAVVRVSVTGGRDDVEGETEALSFDVVRLRRSHLRGVASKMFTLTLCHPFPGALVPADAIELRADAFSALHRIDAILDVFVVRLRRSLLRGVVSKVFMLALRRPFPAALVVTAQVEIESKV